MVMAALAAVQRWHLERNQYPQLLAVVEVVDQTVAQVTAHILVAQVGLVAVGL
jgi:hypothetical protein